MDVVFAADDNFAEPLRVVIASLTRQNQFEALNIWIVDGGISPANQQKIRRGAERPNHTIEFRRMEAQVSLGARTQSHLSDTSLFRLFVPALFADVSRCIYLDVDVFAFAPIKPLWDTDLSGHPLGLVESSWSYYLSYKSTLGIEAGQPYFNAGVMLMDLDHLRRWGAVERCLDFLARRKDQIRFADQDVINAVLASQARPLHPRWNVSTSLYDWRAGNSFTFGAEAVAEAKERPGIAHFTGKVKPWHDRCPHPLAHHYRDLLAEISSG